MPRKQSLTHVMDTFTGHSLDTHWTLTSWTHLLDTHWTLTSPSHWMVPQRDYVKGAASVLQWAGIKSSGSYDAFHWRRGDFSLVTTSLRDGAAVAKVRAVTQSLTRHRLVTDT